MGKSFNIIICGAGLGGLGAAIALARKGHQVTVLEAASQLNEVGAGIQIPPNSSRILKSYGLEKKISESIAWPSYINFRRYATGEVIGTTPLRPTMVEKYGFPYWLIHRADYQRILFDAAKENGVNVLLGSPIERVEESGPIVVLKSGAHLGADVIIGADGIRSRTRESILRDQNVQAADSSNCAYRATVPASVMMSDPAIAHLMLDVNSNCWIGHNRHVMAYPIRHGELYNLVMSHPGKASVGKWNEPGDLSEMKKHYSNFDPTLQKVLSHVTGCLKWKLADIPPLPKWVSDNGRVVLIGDAAHAMVPYLAQGAATSIEDGAALAECLDRAQNINDIPTLLRAFEAIRKPRCEIIQSGSRANGTIWHMPDGPAQQLRDGEMKGILKEASTSSTENPNKWSDEKFQPWLFGYDAIKETNEFLDRILDSPMQESKIPLSQYGKSHIAVAI